MTESPSNPMTAAGKSLVERLRNWTTDWNGQPMVPGEPPRDGIHCDIINEAAAQIERLEREKEEAEKVADLVILEQSDAVNSLAAKLRTERDRTKVLESELTRLKSPMEGAKVSAEELAWLLDKYGENGFVASEDGRIFTIADLLDDRDLYAAQARSAADVENEACARIAEANKQRPCPFDGPNDLEETDPCPVCGELGTLDSDSSKCVSVSPGTAIALSIRARRKGETGNAL